MLLKTQPMLLSYELEKDGREVAQTLSARLGGNPIVLESLRLVDPTKILAQAFVRRAYRV
jgi:hypothetical protein